MAIKVAMVGAGRIARLHAQSLRDVPELELAVVSDPVEAARDSFPGDALRVADWREAMESVDAVMVCSPSSEHPEQVLGALGLGLPVFCEKPLATTAERAEECRAVAESTGGLLQVGFHKRYDPSFRRMRREASTAKKLHLHISVRDPRPSPPEYPRWPGGIFLDCLIHDFDLARYLLGEELRVVAAHAVALFDPYAGAAGDGDTAAVILEAESGALVTLSASRQNPDGYHQHVELQADGEVWTTADPVVDLVRRADRGGTHAPPSVDFFAERYRDAYVAQLRSFAGAVRGEHAVECSGEDGVRAVELALEAGRRSAGRRVADGGGR